MTVDLDNSAATDHTRRRDHFFSIKVPPSRTRFHTLSGFDYHRLLEPLGDIPPAEAEANYYKQLRSQAIPA